MIRILFLLTFLISAGCQAQMKEWQRERAVTRLTKINSYHAMITEKGLLESGVPIVSEIWFTAPDRYAVITRAPASLAGSFFQTDEKQTTIYDAVTKLAVTYKNLPSLPDRSAVVRAAFDQSLETYSFSLGSTSKRAGLPVIELRFKPKNGSIKDSIVVSGVSQIYDEYSFPLETVLNFQKGLTYSDSYSDVTFNSGATPQKLTVPKDAYISDWDYESKAVTEVDAKKIAVGFRFVLPKTKLKLIKIIKQIGPVPALTAFYANGLSVMSVAEYNNFGVTPVRGLKIAGGFLIPNPHLNSFTLTRGNTSYSISSNLPLDEIIQIANSL